MIYDVSLLWLMISDDRLSHVILVWLIINENQRFRVFLTESWFSQTLVGVRDGDEEKWRYPNEEDTTSQRRSVGDLSWSVLNFEGTVHKIRLHPEECKKQYSSVIPWKKSHVEIAKDHGTMGTSSILMVVYVWENHIKVFLGIFQAVGLITKDILEVRQFWIVENITSPNMSQHHAFAFCTTFLSLWPCYGFG